jgi:hypothetical protein
VTLLLGYLAAWHNDYDGASSNVLNKMVLGYTLHRVPHRPDAVRRAPPIRVRYRRYPPDDGRDVRREDARFQARGLKRPFGHGTHCLSGGAGEGKRPTGACGRSAPGAPTHTDGADGESSLAMIGAAEAVQTNGLDWTLRLASQTLEHNGN